MSDGFGGWSGGGGGGGGFYGGYYGGGGDGEASPGCIVVVLLALAAVIGGFLYFNHKKNNEIKNEFNKQGYTITEWGSADHNDNTYSLQRNDTIFRAKLDDDNKPVVQAIGKLFPVKTETTTAFPYSGEKAIDAELYKRGFKITEEAMDHNDDTYSLQRNDTAFTAKVDDGKLTLKAIGRRFPGK